MKALIVKTSSMGDIIHTFPAVTEAVKHFPQLRFDWVVEESFAEIPKWHPAIENVIPVAFRRWRKNLLRCAFSGEYLKQIITVRKTSYDFVIDAQGLIKSKIAVLFSRGKKYGLAKDSIKESAFNFLYHKHISVEKKLHAVTKNRVLFGEIFGYRTLPEGPLNYNLSFRKSVPPGLNPNYIVLLHGTTWPSKQWPEAYWEALIKKISGEGRDVCLFFGSAAEKERAYRWQKISEHVKIMPALALAEIANIISQARACVAVDTGFAHLASALSVPAISLYGATDACLTGALGNNQIHLSSDFACAPCLQKDCSYQGGSEVNPACYTRIDADQVWIKLQKLL